MKKFVSPENTNSGMNPEFDESRRFESQKVPEAETGATDSEASETSCYELRNHMRNNTEIIPVSNDASNINAPKSTDLIDLPVEVPKKTKAKKVFEIPTIEEIANHIMKCWPSSASGWILRNDDLSKFQTDPRNMGLQEFQQVVNPNGFNFMFDFKKQQG